MIEPSAACNLRCPLCPTGLKLTKRSTFTLSLEMFKQALGPFKYTLQYITFWNYGEPFLNAELSSMIRYAASYNIKTQVSTNGHFLDNERIDDLLTCGLTRLIVSVDTPFPATYERYRVGGSYEKVLAGFRYAAERKKALGSKTALVAQYIIMRDNEDINRMIEHGSSLGADRVLVKSLGIGSSIEIPTEKQWSLVPRNHKYWRYESREDLRSKILWDEARCTYIWGRMVLNSDGTCLPCCRDQMSTYKLGSLSEGKSLASIWNSRPYRDYRRHIRETQRIATMCQRCGELVKETIEPGTFELDQPS